MKIIRRGRIRRRGGREERGRDEDPGASENTADCAGHMLEPILYSWQCPWTRGPDMRSRNP